MSASGIHSLEESFPLRDIVAAEISVNGDSWEMLERFPWCHVRPAQPVDRDQGWKLHLSATPLSAPLVLSAAARILVAAGCQFKFAATLGLVREMGNAQAARGGSGKFITAYPADDGAFRRLAADLDAATRGLPGPAVLSDRRYRPGSLVHYRYGAFTGVQRLGNDGTYEPVMAAPDGTFLPDVRKAWFTPPPWAPPAFPAEPASTRPVRKPAAVLLNDRFEVRRAIQHANKGGVFQAVDRTTGEPVVIKLARAHTHAALTGTDSRDILRHETRMLRRLAGTGVVPRVVDLFEQGDELLLAEEFIAGTTLRAWVTEAGAGGPAPTDVHALAGRIVAAVAAVHERGLVLRDLCPNNLMVTPDRGIRLIDLEYAAEPGVMSRRAYTPGYGAPEVAAALPYHPAHDPAADLYALGGTLFFLATGIDPVLVADEPARRTDEQRTACLVAAMRTGRRALHVVADAVLALIRDDPARRATTAEVTALLRDPATTAASPAPVRAQAPTQAPAPAPAPAPAQAQAPAQAPAPADALDPDMARAAVVGRDVAGRNVSGPRVPVRQRPDAAVTLDHAVSGGLHALCSMIDTSGEREVATSGPFGALTDRLSVQHGAAGLLIVLTRTGLRAETSALAGWIRARLPRERTVLPGLHFGRSGVAWALSDAAVTVGDAGLAGTAADLALRVPLRWPNPDVCHGAAGAGLAQVRFWQNTGDPRFLDRIRDCADGLAAVAETGTGTARTGTTGTETGTVGARTGTAETRTGTAGAPDGEVWWPVPATFDSVLAGSAGLGFAHGLAGIGTFLLAAADVTGRDDLRVLAVRAGRTLAGRALADGPARWWPADRGETSPRRRPMSAHWCTGASGIGTFLVKLWTATGDDDFRRLAEGAAETVWQARWTAGPVQCHGTAGDGEFLLDLADATGDDLWAARATALADTVLARAAYRGDGVVFPDETMRSVVADYQTGLAGTLGFLLRVRDGGPRALLPVTAPARRGAPATVPARVGAPA